MISRGFLIFGGRDHIGSKSLRNHLGGLGYRKHTLEALYFIEAIPIQSIKSSFGTLPWRTTSSHLPWLGLPGLGLCELPEDEMLWVLGSAYGNGSSLLNGCLTCLNGNIIYTMWVPPVISWFINPINYSSNYSYKYHKP